MLLHNVPELVVTVLEQHDRTRGLDIIGRGRPFDGVADDLFDLGVWDGGGGGEGVDGAAVLDSLEEGVGFGGGEGTHCLEVWGGICVEWVGWTKEVGEKGGWC